MAKGFEVRGLVATGVPYPGLATTELDVGQHVVDRSHFARVAM